MTGSPELAEPAGGFGTAAAKVDYRLLFEALPGLYLILDFGSPVLYGDGELAYPI